MEFTGTGPQNIAFIVPWFSNLFASTLSFRPLLYDIFPASLAAPSEGLLTLLGNASIQLGQMFYSLPLREATLYTS